jgi:hypothetical protein
MANKQYCKICLCTHREGAKISKAHRHHFSPYDLDSASIRSRAARTGHATRKVLKEK